jgi:hypothetical protein
MLMKVIQALPRRSALHMVAGSSATAYTRGCTMRKEVSALDMRLYVYGERPMIERIVGSIS